MSNDSKIKAKDDFFEYAFRDGATEKKPSLKDAAPVDFGADENWLDGEDYTGQLAVDVYQSQDAIVIKSTIAGVRPEDIDISVNNDMVTIRGKRDHEETVADRDYFYRECYWGGFSRSIILPCDVKVNEIKASMKNGVLTVVLPKAAKVNKVTVVKVQEE